MSTKAELEKALDLISDVASAESDKDKAKASKALEKFDSSLKDKELAEKLDGLVGKLNDAPVSGEAPAAQAASGKAPAAEVEKTEEQKAQEQADFEAARQRVRARAGADYPDR